MSKTPTTRIVAKICVVLHYRALLWIVHELWNDGQYLQAKSEQVTFTLSVSGGNANSEKQHSRVGRHSKNRTEFPHRAPYGRPLLTRGGWNSCRHRRGNAAEVRHAGRPLKRAAQAPGGRLSAAPVSGERRAAAGCLQLPLSADGGASASAGTAEDFAGLAGYLDSPEPEIANAAAGVILRIARRAQSRFRGSPAGRAENRKRRKAG